MLKDRPGWIAVMICTDRSLAISQGSKPDVLYVMMSRRDASQQERAPPLRKSDPEILKTLVTRDSATILPWRKTRDSRRGLVFPTDQEIAVSSDPNRLLDSKMITRTEDPESSKSEDRSKVGDMRGTGPAEAFRRSGAK